VGGTITVGGVTKTITAITSATSLTVDSAFGTFSGQAFTCQTGITQTGTDTMNLSLGAATGIVITNRADLYRIFDVGGQDLFIEGTLTVESRVAQLRNDGSCSNRFEVLGSATGGEIIFNGRKAAAANAPFPYPGFDWLGQNGQKIMRLRSTNASFPAKFTIIDACIRFGADWLTTDSGNFSRITTQGDVCWILCARGTGTSQARLRQDNTTASIDFQANKTFVGVWLNFGVPQFSIKGYTPIDTDGPEINLASVPTASRIVIEDYLTTYVLPSYYAGVQIVLLGSAWTRLKNNLLGTNIAWRSSSSSGGRHNVLEFSKQITIRAQDTAGNLLSDGFMYYQPVGSNVAGVRAKGITSDITFDLSQQAIATVDGAATSEFVFAWGFTTATTNLSSYSYFCTGTTRGAETHVIRSSRYGYDKQSATVSLAGNDDATPTFVHVSLPTTDKVISNAAAITGVAFNFGTKTITVTGALTIQEIYDAYQYQLNQVANLQTADECVVSNGQTNYVGWTINNSGAISEGDNLRTIRAQTINNTGTITAIYSSSAGTSKILEINGVTDGSSLYVGNNATGITTLYQADTNQATYRVYFAPGTTPAQLVARELYPFQRSAQVVTLVDGLNVVNLVDIPDVGITEEDLATVLAYTEIEIPSKYYDRTAAFRLTEQGIKLGQMVTRSGTALENGNFSHLINKDATLVYSVTGSVITTKSTSYQSDDRYQSEISNPPATITANSTEVITIPIQDANGDSQLTINGGDGEFELWKVTTATATADYETGTLIDTVGNVIYRFLSAPGFDIVGVDTNSNIRRRSSMSKGIYTQAFYVGDQIQLAQAPQVIENGVKLDVLAVELAEVRAKTDNLPTAPAAVGDAMTLTADYDAAKTAATQTSVDEIKAKVDTLENADLSALATSAEVQALGDPLQAEDYVAPANADIASIKTTVEAIDVSGIPAAVRVELTPELERIDVAVSTRSTLTATQVWAATTRELTQDVGLTTEQAAQLTNVETLTEALPTLAEIEASTVLAKADEVPSTGDIAASVWDNPKRTLNDALFE
jgi:hypothetical protein